MKEHWNYFLALEADLEFCTRFIEFTKDNFSSYSIEFAKILLACSSEFDVVAKILCRKIDPSVKRENIDDYRKVILSKYRKFSEVEIKLDRYNLSFKPWSVWSMDKNPDWWKAYNNVKHERNKYFNEATLENALLSASGLMVGILYCFYHDTNNNEICIDRETKLLEPKWYGVGEPASISPLFSVPKET